MLAGRRSAVKIGPFEIGAQGFAVIAGPCSVESEEQFRTVAKAVRNSGAGLLRGGIYKLRTNPKSFQGLGSSAVEFVRRVKEELKMPLVSEVTDTRQIEQFIDFIDVFQVGTRNMYNYALLKELGHAGKPVLLKRGFSATIQEWLLAAEYVTKEGNPNVVLCERGIRSFEQLTRNTLDLSAVAYVKAHSDFPVIVDPSHGTGRAELVGPMSLAAAAAGADGLLIEVHENPKEALSDGAQSLDFKAFEALMHQLEMLLKVFDRPLLRVPTEAHLYDGKKRLEERAGNPANL